ncbi:nuclear transport factor 2 family protein [Yinghuangia sp. ASG 101]|uniref:nuclear transport factor 2 family protein n=1 Tax=Yinghuangia sp. ASG 101 TaxID=2896848 RepID=UPI001E4F0772|nr:nuclear transport factor 2 family protein [Yinghuangia sp. ASG 101]UGQ12576.1 nuclear transport factor 2 family protein [Yinghuangia sp. ASG 101]
MDLWELIARERIRDTMALYNWSGDALRLDEMATAFCEDGVLETRGADAAPHGRDAIVRFLSGVGAGADAQARAKHAPDADTPAPRRIVRHVLTNVRFVELTPEHARVAAYFTVFTEIGLDHYGRYRDLFVPVGDAWLIRHRFVSTDWRAADSTMAPPSAVG